MVIGDSPYLHGNEFLAWPEQGQSEIEKRIREEWHKRGTEPNIPDNPWFAFPEKNE